MLQKVAEFCWLWQEGIVRNKDEDLAWNQIGLLVFEPEVRWRIWSVESDTDRDIAERNLCLLVRTAKERHGLYQFHWTARIWLHNHVNIVPATCFKSVPDVFLRSSKSTSTHFASILITIAVQTSVNATTESNILIFVTMSRWTCWRNMQMLRNDINNSAKVLCSKVGKFCVLFYLGNVELGIFREAAGEFGWTASC